VSSIGVLAGVLAGGPSQISALVGIAADRALRAGCHRDYARWRARQIAYGRWQPWADAAPVREHVRQLHLAGASCQAIARAAGVATMTVYRLQHGEPARNRPASARIRTQHAERLLAVTAAAIADATGRRDAAGARRRLRALIAMGHPAAALARCLGTPPRTVWDLVRGRTVTVTHDLHAAICVLYEQMWDLCPPERTGAERRAAAAARTRAARNGWPAPMGLDDDRVDDPAYHPRAQWHPATGTGAVPPAGAAGARRSAGRRSLGRERDLRAVS